MTLLDLKREILIHADMLYDGEAMDAEQAAWTVHQTVGRVLSAQRASPTLAWTAGQIAYCLARYVEDH